MSKVRTCDAEGCKARGDNKVIRHIRRWNVYLCKTHTNRYNHYAMLPPLKEAAKQRIVGTCRCDCPEGNPVYKPITVTCFSGAGMDLQFEWTLYVCKDCFDKEAEMRKETASG